jgi:hypothetical protein
MAAWIDLGTVDDTNFPYTFEQNVSVPLRTAISNGLVRCNVYRPKGTAGEIVKCPVLVTYGPYGKDIHYKE